MNLEAIPIRKSRGEARFTIIASLSALLALTVIAAAPIYFDSIAQLGLQRTLERYEPAQMGSWLHVDGITFNASSVNSTIETATSTGNQLGNTVRDNAVFVRSGNLALNRVNDRFAPPGSLLVYQSIRGSQPAISLVDGRFPSDTTNNDLEVAILDTVAAQYGINLGDSLTLIVPPTSIVHSIPKVVGIFHIDDPNHESWLGLQSTIFDPEQGPTGGRPAIIALTSSDMMERIANRGISDIGELWAFFYPDVDELKQIGASRYLEYIDQFRTQASRELPASSSFSGLESALITLQRQLSFANTATIISGALFATFAIFVLALNLSVIARRWHPEELTLKARGADRKQLATAIAFYVTILCVIPAIAGPLLAAAIIPFLGLLGSFRELTDGEMFPFRITIEQFYWSGAVATLILILYTAPMLIQRPGAIVRHLSRLHDSQSPWFWRANLDIGIVIAAAAIIFELNGRGSLFLQQDDGNTNLSMLAISLPIVASIAASLVALRMLRLIGIAFERLARINFNTMIVLALKTFARSLMRHAVMAMLAAGTMIVVINASSLSATLGRNVHDRIDFNTATDMQIAGIDSAKTTANPAVNEISQLEWVSKQTWATRTQATAGNVESSPNFTMLGIKPQEFAEITTFRNDFADLSAEALMQQIAEFTPTEAIHLPEHIAAIRSTVKLERTSKGRIDIWARIRDAEGTTHTIRMTPSDKSQAANDWHIVSGNVRPDIPKPLQLLALQIYEPPTSPIGNAATLTVASIHAVNPQGESLMISDFDDASVWHPMAASIADNAKLSIINGGLTNQDDQQSLKIEMGRGTDDGVRGIYYSKNGPTVVPMLANHTLLNETGFNIGDQFNGQAYGRFVPFEIRGIFKLFPTMTSDDQPFGVVNVDALLSYLKPVSEPFLADTAELYVTIDRETEIGHEDRIATIKSIDPALRVADREALLNQSSTRLGDAAGWRVVGSIIAASAITLATITTLAVAIHNHHSTQLEAALIESMGGSKIGIAFEASLRIALSMGIGIALGILGGIYGVRFIADRMTRTSSGDTALPPMLLQIDWIPTLIGAICLLGAALAPIVWSSIVDRNTVAAHIRSYSANAS